MNPLSDFTWSEVLLWAAMFFACGVITGRLSLDVWPRIEAAEVRE